MVTRTNSRQVVFRRPFLLSGFDALQPAGSYTASFNGSNLSSGMYFYRLATNGYVSTKKMILLK